MSEPPYLSSRCFPPVRAAEEEAACEALLQRLYVQDRHESYHHAMTPRPEAVFAADVAWFRAACPTGATVLEAGSGTGTCAALLAAAGYRVTGTDLYSPEDLAAVRANFADRENLRFLPLAEAAAERFDAVLSICVLEHILRPDEVLRQWGEQLNPGGLLALVCPNYSGLLFPLRLAVNRLRGRSAWRYRSVGHALRHGWENLWLSAWLWWTGRPGFVRCMPQAEDERITMTDADMDTVHLPSAWWIRNFLEREGFTILSWRRGGRGRAARWAQRLFPGQTPNVRILARRAN